MSDNVQKIEAKVESPKPVEANQNKEEGAKIPEKSSEDGLPDGVKKRFGKLTRVNYELKTQNDTLANELKELRSRFEATQPQKEYASEGERVEALVQRALDDRQKQEEKKQTNQAKVSKTLEKYKSTANHVSDIDDFEDVVMTSEINMDDPVDNDIASFCLNSDSGMRLTYEIASNRELFDSLREASPSVRARMLLKLDTELYSGISAKKAAEVVEDTIEEADPRNANTKKTPPKLIAPVSGKKAPKGGTAISMAEYMEQRNQRIAARKQGVRK